MNRPIGLYYFIKTPKRSINMKKIKKGQKEEFDQFIKELSRSGADFTKVMNEYVGEEKMKRLSKRLVTI